MTIIILIICCLGLTVIINRAAENMAYEISSSEITNPIEFDETNQFIESEDLTENSPLIVPETEIEPTQKIYQGFSNETYIYMLIIIIFGAISTYILSDKVLNPLSDLNHQIKQSTIDNLHEKMPVPNSNDEISELAISFNKMSNRIEKSFSFQKKFTENVAHELRTPLGVIKTKIAVFKKEDNHSKPDYELLIEDITNQTNKLTNIVEIILKLTNNGIIEEKEMIPTEILIESVISEFSTIINDKKIEFELELKKDEIYGNIDLLYQMLYNLIHNSIKYSYSQAKIKIEVTNQNENTLLKIYDYGIGIPDSEKSKIFEPFYYLQKTNAENIDSYGLGLSIVKHIIELHLGSVEIEDNQPQGTIFLVYLPNK